MKIEPILEKEFHHDGRGPELQKVIWGRNGVVLKGFEYYNPEDTYDEEHIKNISLEKVEAYSMTSDEVHGSIVANGETQAAIHKIVNSGWKKLFSPIIIEDCEHYQIMFYDEIYDVLCRAVIANKGRYL